MLEIRRGSRLSFVLGVLLLSVVFGACRVEVETSESPEAGEEQPPVAETGGEPPAEAAEGPPIVEIANARTPLPGVVTGGQPSEEEIEEAAAAGYRTVVSLRTDGEEGYWDEAPKVEELGMRFVSIPVKVAEGLNLENARRLFEVMEDTENHPVLVHCGSGNRVGALFAIKAFYDDGKEAEAALEAGREAGLTRLEEKVREMFETHGR